MFRATLVAFLAVAAFAQTAPPPAEKPPAEVEQAVRARVNEFYTLLQSKQYRKAEALIADDTKDYYYNGSKMDISKFEVQDIQYSENFTRAKATTQVSEHVVVFGFPPGDIILKLPTWWRLENGNWYMYVDVSKQFTPFGTPANTGPHPGAGSPALPPELPAPPSFSYGKVHADKQAIDLVVGGSEQVGIVNESEGFVSVQLGYPVSGLEAKLDRTSVPGGQKAILTLTGTKDLKPASYSVQIMPTQEVITIQVHVK